MKILGITFFPQLCHFTSYGTQRFLLKLAYILHNLQREIGHYTLKPC